MESEFAEGVDEALRDDSPSEPPPSGPVERAEGQPPALPTAPPVELGETAPSTRAAPRELGAEGTKRGTMAAIFAVMVLVHVGLAAKTLGHDQGRAIVRKRSQVEIQMVRPPPPPKPVVIPPQTVQPPPKVAPARQQPRIAAPPPVHDAPAADPIEAPVAEAPPDPGPVGPPGDGTGGPAVQAPPPPPPPAPVLEAKEGANYLKNPRPPYPRIAQREGWEGTVLLRVRVLPSGKPGGIAAQKSSGRGVLDNAAVEAVASWTFVPATQGGAPIAGWVNVPIDFRLQ